MEPVRRLWDNSAGRSDVDYIEAEGEDKGLTEFNGLRMPLVYQWQSFCKCLSSIGARGSRLWNILTHRGRQETDKPHSRLALVDWPLQ